MDNEEESPNWKDETEAQDAYLMELLEPILATAHVMDYTMVVGFFRNPESLDDDGPGVDFHCNVVGPTRFAHVLLTVLERHLRDMITALEHEEEYEPPEGVLAVRRMLPNLKMKH